MQPQCCSPSTSFSSFYPVKVNCALIAQSFPVPGRSHSAVCIYNWLPGLLITAWLWRCHASSVSNKKHLNVFTFFFLSLIKNKFACDAVFCIFPVLSVRWAPGICELRVLTRFETYHVFVSSAFCWWFYPTLPPCLCFLFQSTLKIKILHVSFLLACISMCPTY